MGAYDYIQQVVDKYNGDQKIAREEYNKLITNGYVNDVSCTKDSPFVTRKGYKIVYYKDDKCDQEVSVDIRKQCEHMEDELGSISVSNMCLSEGSKTSFEFKVTNGLKCEGTPLDVLAITAAESGTEKDTMKFGACQTTRPSIESPLSGLPSMVHHFGSDESFVDQWSNSPSASSSGCPTPAKFKSSTKYPVYAKSSDNYWNYCNLMVTAECGDMCADATRNRCRNECNKHTHNMASTTSGSTSSAASSSGGWSSDTSSGSSTTSGSTPSCNTNEDCSKRCNEIGSDSETTCALMKCQSIGDAKFCAKGSSSSGSSTTSASGSTSGSAPDCTTAADCEEACEKTDSPFPDKSLCPNLQCVNKKCSMPSSNQQSTESSNDQYNDNEGYTNQKDPSESCENDETCYSICKKNLELGDMASMVNYVKDMASKCKCVNKKCSSTNGDRRLAGSSSTGERTKAKSFKVICLTGDNSPVTTPSAAPSNKLCPLNKCLSGWLHTNKGGCSGKKKALECWNSDRKNQCCVDSNILETSGNCPLNKCSSGWVHKSKGGCSGKNKALECWNSDRNYQCCEEEEEEIFVPPTDTWATTLEKCMEIAGTDKSKNNKCESDALTATTATGPKISYWCGKVNLHFDVASKMWKSDPNKRDGCQEDKLKYCKKFYPQTTSWEQIEDEKNAFCRAGATKCTDVSTKDVYACIGSTATAEAEEEEEE